MNRFHFKAPIALSSAMKFNMGLLCVMVLAILTHTYLMLQSQRLHDSIIDVAGRQRMLHQKHLQEVLLAKQNHAHEIGRTREILTQSIQVLVHGGTIPSTFQTSPVDQIPPAPTEALSRSLASQEFLLARFVTKADAYLGAGPSSQEESRILGELIALNQQLYLKAEEGVSLYRQYASEQFWRQMGWESLVACVLLGMWVLWARQLLVAKTTAYYEGAERARVQQNLSKSEDQLRSIMENSSDVIFIKDLEGRYLVANEATSKVLGRPLTDIIGKRDDEIFEEESAQLIMEIDRRVMESGQMEATEDLLLIRGKERWFSSIKAPYRDSHGAIQGLIGIVRDINERKLSEIALRESESRLRTIIDNSHDLIVLTDVNGRYLLANPAAAKLFGESVSSMQGKTSFEITELETARVIDEVDRQAITTKKPVRVEKEFLVHNDKEMVFSHQSPLFFK